MTKKKKQIDRVHARYAIDHGEFPREVIASNDRVLIILTQDWCSQWLLVSAWLRTIRIGSDVDVYELVYNHLDDFEEFLRHKERVWNNDVIPYLRYYRAGVLTEEANYVSRRELERLIGVE